MRIIFVSLILTIFFACKQVTEETESTNRQEIEQVASDYFATFAERKDWKKLCSFYAENLEFEDIMLQIHLDSLWQLKRFYKWDEEGERFKKLTPEQEHLDLYSLVVNDSIAVARGRVNPFYYDDFLIDTDWGMEFTIWLYFDENLKIKKQVDWFEYAPEVLESVVKRCRENGFEATPDWLDLSRKE